MQLKKFYSSREVAAMTGLTARQLQWWDAGHLFDAAVATKKTPAGGYTERRYTTLDVLELQTLSALRHRGFSIPRIRRLLIALRDVFGVRLYEVVGEGGPATLQLAGDQLYLTMADGRVYNMDEPEQALLVGGDALMLQPLTARPRRRRTSGSERLSRGRQPDAE